MTGNVPQVPPYGQHAQADAEAARRAQEAQQRAAEADRQAREIAERQRRAAEQAAADQANRVGWSGQQR